MLAFEKYEMRLKKTDSSDETAKISVCFLIGRVMRNAEYEAFLNEIDENVALFLETSQYSGSGSLSMLDNLMKHGIEFIKE